MGKKVNDFRIKFHIDIICNSMLESSFKQDALAQSKLDHPHILRLFSCFTIHEDVCTQKVRIEFNSSDKSVELCHKLVLGGVMMERLSCTLSEVTKQRYPDVLPEDERKLIFKQVRFGFWIYFDFDDLEFF